MAMQQLWSEDAGEGEECKLLSGGFAVVLQVLLGFIALSVLVLKRYQEVPQRPLLVRGAACCVCLLTL